ncbi:hypothetical protein [Phreatobacter sp.]|uniref:hypothetical protein n=1 Tax=Phreatobacter sp. TaxID=1966341 RepID=UPI0025F4F410|nr:hypothetical protein [Phreatobacter sp.]
MSDEIVTLRGFRQEKPGATHLQSRRDCGTRTAVADQVNGLDLELTPQPFSMHQPPRLHATPYLGFHEARQRQREEGRPQWAAFDVEEVDSVGRATCPPVITPGPRALADVIRALVENLTDARRGCLGRTYGYHGAAAPKTLGIGVGIVIRHTGTNHGANKTTCGPACSRPNEGCGKPACSNDWTEARDGKQTKTCKKTYSSARGSAKSGAARSPTAILFSVNIRAVLAEPRRIDRRVV